MRETLTCIGMNLTQITALHLCRLYRTLPYTLFRPLAPCTCVAGSSRAMTLPSLTPVSVHA